jgi:hypothetical protein
LAGLGNGRGFFLEEGKGDVNLFSRFQRDIEATDRQIDQLGYELYGLAEEETKIVEGEV